MDIRVVDQEGNPIDEPYILRIWGWTEDRYLREAPRDRKCEYVRGEIILTYPTSARHSMVMGFLGCLLRGFVSHQNLGEALMRGPTIRFLPEVCREPDLCFYPKSMLPISNGIPVPEIPPFVVEVSWATQRIDLFEKVRDYKAAGVEEYWVVDLDEEELVIHLKEQDYQPRRLQKGKVKSQVIKGFWIQCEWLFEEPSPSTLECLRQILGSLGKSLPF